MITNCNYKYFGRLKKFRKSENQKRIWSIELNIFGGRFEHFLYIFILRIKTLCINAIIL